MPNTPPSLIIVAGPNGDGKSTAAPALLRETLGVTAFVNAAVIAQGLSAFEPKRVAFAAGRIMLARIQELAQQGANFAFETTLSSKSFARWIRQLMRTGYQFHLVFLWLSSADMAVQRVADRVRLGGHDVREAIIRRRYDAGLRNFFALYQPLGTTWRMYDNSNDTGTRLIAAGRYNTITQIDDIAIRQRLNKEYRHGD